MLNRREEKVNDLVTRDLIQDNEVTDIETLIKTMWNLDVDVKIPRVELGKSVFLDKLHLRMSEYYND